MRFKRPEGASETLGIMLLLFGFALICLFLWYMFQPDIFAPAIRVVEVYLNGITSYFNRS